MRILHFAPDDKFLPFVQRTFEEVYPGKNEYRVSGNPNVPLQFFSAGNNVRVVGSEYWTSRAAREDMNNCDCLLVHYMTSAFARAAARAPNNVLVGWIGWGADYYRLIEKYFGDLHLPETKKIVRALPNDSGPPIKYFLLRLNRLIRDPSLLPTKLQSIISRQRSQHFDVQAIAPRLDFAWINPEEVQYFEQALPAFKGRYHRICYYSAEEIFRAGSARMNGSDILVGNSATPTNNHFELFEKLKTIDLGSRQLIVPLNYGDSRYADEIERIGFSIFGSRFVPLRQFMPLDEYNKVISRCGTIMMNHIRQQAGTTIATGLYKGAKVYLRNENIVGPFYRKMGIRVFSIQDDLTPGLDLFGPLSEQEMQKNQEILEGYWGHEAALNDIRELTTMVNEKRCHHA